MQLLLAVLLFYLFIRKVKTVLNIKNNVENAKEPQKKGVDIDNDEQVIDITPKKESKKGYKADNTNRKGDSVEDKEKKTENAENEGFDYSEDIDRQGLEELKDLRAKVRQDIVLSTQDDKLDRVLELVEMWKKVNKEIRNLKNGTKTDKKGFGYGIGRSIGRFVGGIKDGFSRN